LVACRINISRVCDFTEATNPSFGQSHGGITSFQTCSLTN